MNARELAEELCYGVVRAEEALAQVRRETLREAAMFCRGRDSYTHAMFAEAFEALANDYPPKCKANLCPKCGSHCSEGYGLAYGGIVAYSACNECDWFSKTQDADPKATPVEGE